MSANSFEMKIRSRFPAKVIFNHENGTHVAFFPDEGIRIVGNLSSPVVTVNWGSGHTAMATL